MGFVILVSYKIYLFILNVRERERVISPIYRFILDMATTASVGSLQNPGVARVFQRKWQGPDPVTWAVF